MRTTLRWAAGLALAAAAAAGGAAVPPERAVWIVQLRPGVAPRAVGWVRPQREFRRVFPGFTALLTPLEAERLRRDGRVVRVVRDEPVRLGPSRPVVFSEAAVSGAGKKRQRIPTGIRRVGATGSPTAAIDGVDAELDVDVAVIDTGIDLRHPDLNVAGGYTVVGDTFDDGHGHGTHVAGIIGARDNNRGVVGVAPGCRLWAVRVLDSEGSGSWADVISGLDWVLANAETIDVVNMSLGGALADEGALRSAIAAVTNSGIPVVVASGNFSSDIAGTVPARFPEVICVSAMADSNGVGGASAGRFKWRKRQFEVDETQADFSNFGEGVALTAPGVRILSTWKRRRYAIDTGTSQSTPHVTGAAALYLLAHPEAGPEEVREALRQSGEAFSPPDDPDGVFEPVVGVGGL